MRERTVKGNMFGILSVAVMVCSTALSATPVYAQTKVVVIPLTESASGPPAPVPKTGQTTPAADYDDGYYKKGVAAPSPRFTDNINGTVTDRLSGLIWLKNGNCTEFYSGDPNFGHNDRLWAAAVTSAHQLRSGYCGLTDGSAVGAWRLPNRKELDSLIDLGQYNPALPPDCPLAATTVASYYWSSTTGAYGSSYAWSVGFDYGVDDGSGPKSGGHYVRAVRVGQ
jgi:hypothetical protein